MPRTLVLHIGTMKTGSTTIQHVLAGNREALLARGFAYPPSQSGTSHTLLAMCFASLREAQKDFDDLLWGGRDPVAVLAAYRETFPAEIAALPAAVHTVIMSCENFSRLMQKRPDLEALRDFLAPLFDRIRIVIYLRRQDGYFTSKYSQTLRNGMIGKPRLTALKNGLGIYDYAALLERWAEVFGEDAVTPRIFERDTDRGYDVVADFLGVVGLETLPALDGPAAPRNPSMNLAGQRILRDVGRMVSGDGADKAFAGGMLWKRLTHAVTAALPGQGWRPTRAEAEAFMAQFDAVNEVVRARWFPAQGQLFSADFSHLPEEAEVTDRKTDNEAHYRVMIGLLEQMNQREAEVARRRAERVAPGQREAKRGALMRALRRDMDDAAARLQLATLQADEGAMEVARHNVLEVLRRNPGDEGAAALLGRLGGGEAS